MKLLPIRGAFPWRIAGLLALVLCLPLLTFWAWFKWELPPLQRYYLATYWSSSEGAKQPGTQTQIRWLLETAPGRKSRYLMAPDATEGKQDGMPLELSSEAVGQRWTKIEKSSIQSIDSTELDGVLREYFYDGQSFHQLVMEPLFSGSSTLLIVVYLVFIMREEIGGEWRQLRRVNSEPEWGGDSGRNFPPYRRGSVARIRSRIARWNDELKDQLSWARFIAIMRRLSNIIHFPKTASSRDAHGRVPTGVQRERAAPLPLADSLTSKSPRALRKSLAIFPGSSTDETRDAKPKPWDESDWID